MTAPQNKKIQKFDSNTNFYFYLYIPSTTNKRFPASGPRTREFPIVPFVLFTAFSNSVLSDADVRFAAVELNITS